MTYEKAYEELQTIIEKLEAGEISLHHLPQSVHRAGELINLCKDKLRGIENELHLITSDEEE